MEIPVRNLPADLQWLNSNTNRNYYNALWSTLIELQPTKCLEIGTFMYYSAKVFSRYFEEYKPDGVLITADISEWNRDTQPPKRVYPIMVYPHVDNIGDFHGGINVYHKNYKKVLEGKYNAAILNGVAIWEKMDEHNITLFDFTFVDGGHDEISAKADIDVARNLTHNQGYILIDDITNNDHALRELYQELKKYNNFYEYQNWSGVIDMGLIKSGELSLCR